MIAQSVVEFLGECEGSSGREGAAADRFSSVTAYLSLFVVYGLSQESSEQRPSPAAEALRRSIPDEEASLVDEEAKRQLLMSI